MTKQQSKDDEQVTKQSATKLASSPIVCNAKMNRGRIFVGPNSYCESLNYDLVTWIEERLNKHGQVTWLDLCCGEGHALQQAALHFGQSLQITGVDLFCHRMPRDPLFEFRQLNLPQDWSELKQRQPAKGFDLITSVHGIHYIGDKLGLLECIARSLAHGGLFLGHFDFQLCRDQNGRKLRGLQALLSKAPWQFHSHSKVLELEGCARSESGAITTPKTAAATEFATKDAAQRARPWRSGFRFVAHDDQFGPSFTGVAAVGSIYAKL